MTVRHTVLGMMLAVCLIGCKQDAGSGGSTTQPGKMTIAVLPKGTTHDFWTAVHAGAQKAATEFDVNIIWKGPSDEGSFQQQVNIVEDMITRGVDGMVLAPTHGEVLADVIIKAHKRGIPVTIFDSGTSAPESAYVAFAATDNYKGGQLGARHLAKLIGGKGKVAMVKTTPGGVSTMKREAGFRDTLKKEFPDIELVDEQWGNAKREDSVKAATDMLTRHQGKLDGFFGSNETSAVGVLLALEERKLGGKIKFVGFDASPDLIAGMKRGTINALVVQDPYRMGYQGVKSLIDHKAGKDVPKFIDTGVYVVTPENMDEPKMAKLLNPPKVRS